NRPKAIHESAATSIARRWFVLAAGLIVDRPGFFAVLETLDDRVDPPCLDLFAKVRPVTADVADTLDLHVIRLPALRGLVQVVVDFDRSAVGALDLGAYSGLCRVGIDFGGGDLEPIGGEVDQR